MGGVNCRATGRECNMLRSALHRGYRWIVLTGVLVALTGCDPTVRTTVENGVISTSTAAFGSFLSALFSLAIEAQTGTTG
jgi:hypothetical protein